MFDAPPDPKPRPKLAYWMFERRLTPRDAGRQMDCSHEQVRRAILPFEDPSFRVASPMLRKKVEAWTGGEIGSDDWSVPSAVQADAMAEVRP